MRTHLRVPYATVALALFMMMVGAAQSKAQCTKFTYVNTTSDTVTICLFAPGVPGQTPIPCETVLPSTTIKPDYTPNSYNVTGVISATGVLYTWVTNPAPPPASYVPSVALPTASSGVSKCYNVYWDASTCTVTIVAAGAPPCTNP